MNKNFVIAAILIAFLSVTIYSFPMNTSEDNSKIAFHSAVCIYKNDILVGECTHNTMMNVGLNWTRDLIGNAATSGSVKNIVLGNTTTAESAALTTLAGQINECGLEPAAGTYAALGNGNFSTSKVWTSSCDSEIVNTTALYNISAPGASCTATNCTMFAGKNFAAPVTLQSGDQLNVTWYVWVS